MSCCANPSQCLSFHRTDHSQATLLLHAGRIDGQGATIEIDNRKCDAPNFILENRIIGRKFVDNQGIGVRKDSLILIFYYRGNLKQEIICQVTSARAGMNTSSALCMK
jgi:hypothetical protein